ICGQVLVSTCQPGYVAISWSLSSPANIGAFGAAAGQTSRTAAEAQAHDACISQNGDRRECDENWRWTLVRCDGTVTDDYHANSGPDFQCTGCGSGPSAGSSITVTTTTQAPQIDPQELARQAEAARQQAAIEAARRAEE